MRRHIQRKYEKTQEKKKRIFTPSRISGSVSQTVPIQRAYERAVRRIPTVVRRHTQRKYENTQEKKKRIFTPERHAPSSRHR